MPLDFSRDWQQVADEEAALFGVLREQLRWLGRDHDDFSAHGGRWEMHLKTQEDVTARTAHVP